MTTRIAPLAIYLSLALAAPSLAQDGSTALGRLDHARYGAPSSYGTTIDPLFALAIDVESEAAPALAVVGGMAGDPLLWLLGIAPADFDLGLGARLLIDPSMLVAIPDVVRHDAPGLRIPAADASAHGLEIYAQAITLVAPSSGGGALLSDGRSMRLSALGGEGFQRKGAGLELLHLTDLGGGAEPHGLLASVTIESPGYSLELVSMEPGDEGFEIVLAVVSPIVPSANRARAARYVPLDDLHYGQISIYLADILDGQVRDPKLVAHLFLER